MGHAVRKFGGSPTEVFAKGIVRYDVETIRQNLGRRTTELPDGVSHEVVHADDLVVLP